MSGWDFLEGNNKRIGARVIENAKLRHNVRRLGLDRVCAATRNTQHATPDTRRSPAQHHASP
eukprot:3524808-Prymnesium_polylepis.1